MKRNLFFLFAVLATTFASATVTSSNTLCWIKVNNTCTNVVISTALVDVGLPATSSIDVSNFILTKNLHVGDSLTKKVWSAENERWSRQGWAVVNAGTDAAPNLVWQATGVTDGNYQFAAADSGALAVANAFVLHRSDPVASNPIYIRGQVECAVARTQTATEQVTLMANAGLTDVDIASIPWTTAPANGDKIRFLTDNAGTGTVDYTWTTPDGGSSACWCTNIVSEVSTPFGSTYTETPTAASGVTVPVGQGFYFTRKSTSGAAPSITWSVD